MSNIPKFSRILTQIGPAALALLAACGSHDSGPAVTEMGHEALEARASGTRADHFAAPAGDRKTTRSTVIEGRSAAVLPNGRLLTPLGTEIPLDAPKPFGLAVSRDGSVVATANSGAARFSVSLLTRSPADRNQWDQKRIDLDSTFMGLALSPDGDRFYASGGEDGNLWIGDTRRGAIVGSVNLNGAAHPLSRPSAARDPAAQPVRRRRDRSA